MKKKTIVGLVVLILLIAVLSVILGLAKARAPQTPAQSPEVPGEAVEAPEEAAEVIQATEGESGERPPVPTAEEFVEGYYRVVGSFHPGTAGSSLVRAQAACAAVHFAAEHRIAEVDVPLLRSTMLAAWESLTEEERGYFDENFVGLAELIDACEADWESNRPLFDDAGAADQMAVLMDEPAARECWATLCAHTLTLGNSEG